MVRYLAGTGSTPADSRCAGSARLLYAYGTWDRFCSQGLESWFGTSHMVHPLVGWSGPYSTGVICPSFLSLLLFHHYLALWLQLNFPLVFQKTTTKTHVQYHYRISHLLSCVSHLTPPSRLASPYCAPSVELCSLTRGACLVWYEWVEDGVGVWE